MTKQNQIHDFHIPVMGTAFTIDTPIKVAEYGISSVISIIDDELIEEMRAFYCEKFDLSYTAISKSSNDPRANRITSYLNLVQKIVQKRFVDFKKKTNREYSSFRKLYFTITQSF